MAVTPRDFDIVEGIDERCVSGALRMFYAAFAAKLRIGFRDANDLVRLFHDSVDRTSCFSAIADGRCVGLLTFQAGGREFFHLRAAALVTRFSPLRAVLVLVNLLLLDEDGPADAFIVETLAVDRSARGMGVGTALLRQAEAAARAMGVRRMLLGVIAENHGAIRLYERLGYRTTRTQRGFLLRLATGSAEVRQMEKPLAGS